MDWGRGAVDGVRHDAAKLLVAAAQREVDRRGGAAWLEVAMAKVARVGGGMGVSVRNWGNEVEAATGRAAVVAGWRAPACGGNGERHGESEGVRGKHRENGEKDEGGAGCIFIARGGDEEAAEWRIWGGNSQRRGRHRGQSGGSIWRQKLRKSGGFGGGGGGEPILCGLGARA
uniref:Uncharacterized protein n=1 Tax=Oryza sativa subsp. japonica TaxID=39947 RepID=Q6K1Z3_ORYSJ|nr:hypothetical protein [Oryza sativa Japonica Group]